MRAMPQTPYYLEPNQRIELRSIGSDGLIDTMEAGSGEMFFFFVGGMEQGARWVVKEAAGRCLQGGVELLGCCCSVSAEPTKSSRPSTSRALWKKALKLFSVPVSRWPGKDPAYLCREFGLLALGSLGAEPGPSLLPREARVTV